MAEPSRPLIRTVDVTRDYRLGGATVRALRGVSLTVHRGEFVAVMGPSGSGKSTLLTLLGCLDRPSSGRYLLDGRDVGRLDSDARAAIRSRKVGLVFQSFNLLGRSTAIENIELPLVYGDAPRAERRARAAAALAAVGLGHRRDHWPRQLSGGEQQRVAIARALVNDPLLLLADEPTGALDSGTGLLILATFQALNRAGRTIVLVTHDATVARHARRIVAMHDGRVVRDEPVAAPADAAAALPPAGDAAATAPEPAVAGAEA
ncbi:MAG TPA: ABC transporter ATP-binding protein [Geminicoccaceae bacterium]|nr:ABC transporter ATP-binding protein [Geminicoccaceae bacterium]